MLRGGQVPIAPFLALIEEQVEKLGSLDIVCLAVDGLPYKTSALGRRVSSWRTGRNNAHGCVYEPKTLSFDLADRIVTRLLGPEAWFTRPELLDIYGGER